MTFFIRKVGAVIELCGILRPTLEDRINLMLDVSMYARTIQKGVGLKKV